MNISYNWLRQYLDFDHTPDKLAKLLTACGLEVESIEPFESVKGGLKGLVVAEVMETGKHPNADRLTVCKVNLGGDEVSQIVCGAPNVAAGQKVVVARPGITIHPLKGAPFEIKKSKIRGEESVGMICAEDEIGLGENHDGIIVLGADAKPGDSIIKYFNVENDFTISIGLTPNRPDAASHIGVGRDIRAVLNTLNLDLNKQDVELRWPDVSNFSTPEVNPVVTVKVESEACTRYSGIHITNIKVEPSPEWLQNKLRAVGLGPINNIVDITNFVLYELGQPLHAFDSGKINNRQVIVKMLPSGTSFTTLDGIERKLDGTELMICDDLGGMCIAGVFGGIGSGVSEQSTEVFLESACFDAVSIRKTSKLHGLKTDASFRFERGSDPNITVFALQRAALMMCEIAGGKISSSIIDIYPHPVKDWKLDFSFGNFKKLTGVDIAGNSFVKILSWLDIKVTSESDGVLHLEIPPYRVDVTREVDVVEEVLRIYGYDRIPLPAKMNTSLPSPPLVLLERTRKEIASMLTAAGFYEVMSNSLYRSIAFESDNMELVKIKNPLSQDLDIMRFNMLFPLLDVALYNHNRKRFDLRLFEFGKTYHKQENGYNEINHLAILITGKRNSRHWNVKPADYDIYFLKSVVENIISASRLKPSSLTWEPVDDDLLGSSILLNSKKKELARIGAVNRRILKKFDLSGDIWYADINLDTIEKLIDTTPRKIAEPPRFPEVRRDLSMLLDKTVNYGQLETLAYETERKLLRDVNLFDVYEGDKIGHNKKSYAMSFVLRDDEKTLTDKDIEKVMNRLMDAYEKQLGAVIRKG